MNEIIEGYGRMYNSSEGVRKGNEWENWLEEDPEGWAEVALGSPFGSYALENGLLDDAIIETAEENAENKELDEELQEIYREAKKMIKLSGEELVEEFDRNEREITIHTVMRLNKEEIKQKIKETYETWYDEVEKRDMPDSETEERAKKQGFETGFKKYWRTYSP